MGPTLSAPSVDTWRGIAAEIADAAKLRQLEYREDDGDNDAAAEAAREATQLSMWCVTNYLRLICRSFLASF